MDLERKKVFIVYCGGARLPESSQKGLNNWLKGLLELSMMADVTGKYIYDGTGSGVDANVWKEIIKTIKTEYNKYDGFVVTHGLDNILITANTLSYLIQDSGKPIIFTGSPLIEAKVKAKQPIKKIFKQYQTLGIKANLINAVQVATIDISRTSLMFGNRLINPTRAIQTFDSNLNIFSSWQTQDLAKIQFGIQTTSSAFKRSKDKPNIQENFPENIKIIDASVGNPEKVELTGNEEGVFIRSSHENPEDIIKQIKTDLPILVLSQGHIDEKEKIISAQGYTYESALGKFIWALAKTKDIKEIRKIFKKNYIGEI
ncbi:MAG: asparaginase domain-containing protein [Patescibacteria group bacterium]